MLTLKPNCEFCDIDLPADSRDARICSYECTFCSACVERVLSNVCPNCGGGFYERPIRPKHAYRDGVSLAGQPGSIERVNTKYAKHEITDFAAAIKDTPAHER